MKKLRHLIFAAVFAASIAAHAKPNVIFILADDLGYGDTGFSFQNRRPAAEARIQTPNLDRLASEGVVLTDHYCAAPVCAPSRASIMTGRLQGRCSVKNNMFDHPITEKDTLGTLMSGAGYRTMAIGKWGIGGGGESGTPVSAHPLDKGFGSFYGFMDHMAGHTYYHYDGFIRGAYMGIWDGREKATDGAKGIYSTDLFTARAKKEISQAVREHPGEPFFLYMAVNAVHGSGQSDSTLVNRHPLHVPGRPYPEEGLSWPLKPEPPEDRNTWIDPRCRDFANENMQRYATAIARLDDAIGDLTAHLEKLGVAGDTIIIFTSDNGPADEYGADTRFFRSAGPFDGLKRDVYEGGMRVPAFVWRKGGFDVKEDGSPSISTDWMATLAELAGTEKPESCDGVSLLPRWTGGKGEKSRIETVYCGGRSQEKDFAEFAARKRDLVRGEQRMRRDGDIVMLQAGGADKPWRRYNVKEDPHQDRDLDEQVTPGHSAGPSPAP
ncbi:MAG: sulfatase-like hydrolase/transferase [Kiritimatiellae bacterium]|nr:sulfatase-like hydrolase/transferase [Kiritimatiellia bacterium]